MRYGFLGRLLGLGHRLGVVWVLGWVSVLSFVFVFCIVFGAGFLPAIFVFLGVCVIQFSVGLLCGLFGVASRFWCFGFGVGCWRCSCCGVFRFWLLGLLVLDCGRYGFLCRFVVCFCVVGGWLDFCLGLLISCGLCNMTSVL